MRLLCIFFMFIIFYCNIIDGDGYIVDPGPVVRATKGQIWPAPKSLNTSNTYFIIRPFALKFVAIRKTCDTLDEAFNRYSRIITSRMHSPMAIKRYQEAIHPKRNWINDPNYRGELDTVHVDLLSPCENKPYLGMDETYRVKIENASALIQSNTVWGILRGLESFSQLLVVIDNHRVLKVNTTSIYDEPLFSHRGLLLDTSRHFISVFIIKQILDGMAYNKLNLFHWHIVDDHSFPYQSKKFPELSEKGAYIPEFVYTPNDIATIIEYARLRGIRVMAEFDTPGHTRSWGISHPELLTKCGIPYEGKLGPINPINTEVYDFLQQLFAEVVQVFPDQFVHLGGDEVGFECWSSNREIEEYMKTHNMTKFEELEEEFIQKIVDIVDNLNAKSIVWQEVYVNGVRLPAGTVVHVWTGDQKELLRKITNEGFPALLSTCWYLDHLSTGGDWRKFYGCDPLNFNGTEEQKALIMGGEACMWSEVVDNSNVLQRIFPRVSATAERLWSHEYDKLVPERLEEHTCRMKLRGIPAQPPTGPGFCG